MLNNNSNYKVAVTGASGYIGSALSNELAARSFKLMRVSKKTLEPLDNSESLIADISKLETWLNIVEKTDIIFHLAGNTSTSEANKNPIKSLKTSLLPLMHFIKASQKLKKKPRLIYASTATVYGLTPSTPVNENFDLIPESLYDLHKIFFEKHMNLAARNGILDGASLRLSNVYGASLNLSSSNDRGVLNNSSLAALYGKDLTLYGSGNFLRDYVYIDDVVDAFMTVGLSKDFHSSVYNVGAGKSLSIKTAFELIAKHTFNLTGNSIKINHVDMPKESSAIEYRNYIADVSYIYKIHGWRAKINLDVGLEIMMTKFKEKYIK